MDRSDTNLYAPPSRKPPEMQHHPLGLGLHDAHAVERVAVVEREAAGKAGVFSRDRQFRHRGQTRGGERVGGVVIPLRERNTKESAFSAMSNGQAKHTSL